MELQERVSLDKAAEFDIMNDEVYEFNADGERFRILFGDPVNRPLGVEMSFYPMSKSGAKYGLEKFAMEPRSSLEQVGIILATCASAALDYLANHDWIREFWVVADKADKSRAPLYSRLIKELAAYLNARPIQRTFDHGLGFGFELPQKIQEKYETRGSGRDFLSDMLRPDVIAKLTRAEEPYEVFEDLCGRHGVMLEPAWTSDDYVYPEQGIQAAQAFDNDELELQVDVERITEILDWLKDDGPLRTTEYEQLIKMASVLITHEKLHHAQYDSAGPMYTVRAKDLDMEKGNFEYLSNEREIHAHAAAAIEEWLVKGYKPEQILSWLGNTKLLKDHAGESNDFWKYWDYFGSVGSDDPRDMKVWREFLLRCADFAQQEKERRKLVQEGRLTELLDSDISDVKVLNAVNTWENPKWQKGWEQYIKYHIEIAQMEYDIAFYGKDIELDDTGEVTGIQLTVVFDRLIYSKYEDVEAVDTLVPTKDMRVVFKLFTFIAQKLVEVSEVLHPVEVTFMGKNGESSRVPFYDRLSKILADRLGGVATSNHAGNLAAKYTVFSIWIDKNDPIKAGRMEEAISPNYYKDGGPTREQNEHTTFDTMGTSDDSISFLHGFDLGKVYDEVHRNWPRADNTRGAPEVRGRKP